MSSSNYAYEGHVPRCALTLSVIVVALLPPISGQCCATGCQGIDFDITQENFRENMVPTRFLFRVHFGLMRHPAGDNARSKYPSPLQEPSEPCVQSTEHSGKNNKSEAMHRIRNRIRWAIIAIISAARPNHQVLQRSPCGGQVLVMVRCAHRCGYRSRRQENF